MDTLTFASPILLKHLTFSEAKKMPVHEVNLAKALEGLGLDMNQFIDLCILLGCDYMEPVKGIGPKTAFKLIKEYGSIEKVKEHLEEREEEKRAEAERKGKEKARGVSFPEIWPYEEARAIFRKPDVVKADDMEVGDTKVGKENDSYPADINAVLPPTLSSNGNSQTSKGWSSSSALTKALLRTEYERELRSCKRRWDRNSRVDWMDSSRAAGAPSERPRKTARAKRVVQRIPRRRRRSRPWVVCVTAVSGQVTFAMSLFRTFRCNCTASFAHSRFTYAALCPALASGNFCPPLRSCHTPSKPPPARLHRGAADPAISESNQTSSARRLNGLSLFVNGYFRALSARRGTQSKYSINV